MASRYWVGGSAAWDSSTTSNWSATSGGSSGASVPTTSDDVFFDANSGTVTISGTVTRNSLDLDFTGFTGTYGGSGSNSIIGSLTLGSGMTYTHTGNLSIQGAGAQTFTTNNVTITAAVLISDANIPSTSVKTLVGNLTINAANNSITLSNGTFDANGYNVTISNANGGRFICTTTNVVTLNMGSGTWSFNTGIIDPWNVTATNLTLNQGTSTIKFTGALTANRSFIGDSKTYYNFWNATTGSFAVIITGSNTFNDFKIDANRTQNFTAGTTQTVSTFTATGTAGNLVTLNSTTTGTFTLSKSTGIVSSDYMNIQHSVATGGANWYAGTHSTNNQAVATAGSGWIFTAPPSAVNSGFFGFM